MPSAAKTWITIPCYNEARRLRVDAFERFANSHSDVRLLFVDDGSDDDTQSVLRGLAERNEAAFGVLVPDRNLGKAQAVRSGMNEAMRAGAVYAGYWDADLAAPLDEIPAFIELLDTEPELQVLLGSRVKLLGRQIERRAIRHYTGRVAATAISLTLSLPVYDTQCGAKLFRVSDRCRSLFAEPFVTTWAFDVEILARLIEAARHDGEGPPSRVIREVPLWEWRDVAGSKVRPIDFLKSMVELAKIWNRHLRLR